MTTSRLPAGLLAAAGVLVLLTGCSNGTIDTQPDNLQRLNFTTIRDNTGSAFYSIGATAVGVTNNFGTTRTMPIETSNANCTKFDPISGRHLPK